VAVPSLWVDLGSSLFTQLLVVLGNVLSLRLAAQVMSPDGVGELAFGRRVLVFLTPVLLLGMGVGLPRTLGNVYEEPRRVHATTAAGWSFGILVALVAAAVVHANPEALARVFFGSAQHLHLVEPLVLMILGQQAFLLTFAVLRGRLQIRRANLLQVLHAGMVPVVAVTLVGSNGAASTLKMIGMATTVLAGLSVVVLWRSIRFDFSLQVLRASLATLLRYGLPRVPGDVANAGLYALGPLLAAHAMDLGAAGMLAIGLQLLTVIAAAFSPLGMVLLPRLSRALAGDSDERVRQALPTAVAVVAYAGAFMAVFGAAFGNTWLGWVLGPEFRIDRYGLALLALAAGANVLVVVLRSWNDAAYFRPVNAVNALLALAIQFVSWWVLRRTGAVDAFVAICAAIAISFLVQALLTLAAIAHRFHLGVSPRIVARWIAVQAILCATVAVLPYRGALRGAFGVFLGQVVALGAWLLVLRWLGEPCFGVLLRGVRNSRRPALGPGECGPAGNEPIDAQESIE
jgi:O-antigen/teichoic acid export membrane protein